MHLENIRAEQIDLNEKKEEKFLIFGEHKTNAKIWASARMWLISVVKNTRGANYNEYFKVPLVKSAKRLSNKDRGTFYCWFTVINRFNQNSFIDGYNRENKPIYKHEYYFSKDIAIAYFLFNHSNEIDNNKRTTIRKSFDEFIRICELLDEIDILKTSDNKGINLSVRLEIFNSINKNLFDCIVKNSICEDFQIIRRHIVTFYIIMTSSQVKPIL